MNLKKEQAEALRRARGFAKSGNAVWAQLWVERAHSFLAVSERQLKNVQRLLDSAKK